MHGFVIALTTPSPGYRAKLIVICSGFGYPWISKKNVPHISKTQAQFLKGLPTLGKTSYAFPYTSKLESFGHKSTPSH